VTKPALEHDGGAAAAPITREDPTMNETRSPALDDQRADNPYRELAALPPPPMYTADMLPPSGPDRSEVNRRVGQGLGQLMTLGVGILLLVIGGLTLSQIGFEVGSGAARGSVAGLHHTALMAVIDLGLGLVLVLAGARSRLDWGSVRLLGGVSLSFGVVLLAEPPVLNSWLGADAASGWLLVVIGSVMLVGAIVHPLVLGDETA
jgi:hypothetical protein